MHADGDRWGTLLGLELERPVGRWHNDKSVDAANERRTYGSQGDYRWQRAHVRLDGDWRRALLGLELPWSAGPKYHQLSCVTINTHAFGGNVRVERELGKF